MASFYYSICLGVIGGDLDLGDTVILEELLEIFLEGGSIVCDYFLNHTVAKDDAIEEKLGYGLGSVSSYGFTLCDA